ncbi:hypothetical protein GDO86_010628 [Hymenochirus boettgeri]|uniref:Taste receptor type 2 n=1 Tax=Hymenochirus boettgeri TaxID=247094 RepID=A0A8T2JR22_9PIPI|nr:hypothetical protein GDO86_010628 [Hymenochirus boettgeri]
MFFPLQIALLVVLWIEAVVGIIINAFIVAVIVFWWIHSGKVKTIDFILACLGLSRLTLIIVFVIVPWIPVNVEIILATSMFVTFCSLWFATKLCFFYCMKICNYCSCILVFLESNVFKMIFWTLFTSITPSLICTLPFNWIVFIKITNNTSDGSINVNRKLFILYFSGTSLPFFIFCVAVSLLIRSLWKHTRHLTRNNPGFNKAQLRAHVFAVKGMVSFLVIYIIFFISSNLKFEPSMSNNTTVQPVLSIIICSYPTVHSVILVLVNRKMKKALCCFLCCLREDISSESN